MDKSEAKRLSKTKSGGSLASDKRNLYLANEGLAFKRDKNRARNRGKTASDRGEVDKNDMSDEDRAKRERAQAEKKKKLQNPLFFVSANRFFPESFLLLLV